MENMQPHARLAQGLTSAREAILARWGDEVAASGKVTLVETLSRQEFYDNIPNFLEQICARLRGDVARPTTPARHHGAHRWQQGLSFAEIVHEWSLLHRILIEQVGSLWAAAGVTTESLPQVYRLLAENVEQAIETSLSEYSVRLRQQAEARAYDLEAALEERKDRDQARGRGLHQASHDLRGSLQTIRNGCYLLQKQQLKGETGAIIEWLARAGDNLNRLFSDLLDLARLEAGREQRHLSYFDASELLGELVAAMRSSAETHHLTLNAHGDDGLMVQGDPVKLRRIAQNLVSNAINHTAGGEIEVGWYAQSAGGWAFYVQDSGPGMAITDQVPLAANLERAGRGVAETAGASSDAERWPDESANERPPSGRGEGIGLAIVHELCELLDAVLEIDSGSGRGTLFRVQLPLSYDEPAESGYGPLAQG